MSDAEARRERFDEEKISTADLAGARTDSSTDRRASHAEAEDIIEIKPEERDVGAVEVQTTDVTAQAVPVEQAGETAAVRRVPASEAARESHETQRGPLFSAEETAKFRSKWDAIQVSFVDEPRRSVEEADSLVAATMKRLAEEFAAERSNLEGQWDRGSDVSTEDLRIALRRYRSFFGRLLTI